MNRHLLCSDVTGDGAVDIDVHLLDRTMMGDWRSDRSPLLAIITGGDLNVSQNAGIPQCFDVTCSSDVTDFEHDRSKFIDLKVVAPTLLSSWGGENVYVGTLATARMWPAGFDPATQADQDTPASLCDGWPETNQHPPHRMGAYLPPFRDEIEALLPAFVRLVVRPSATYVAAVHAARNED